MSDIFLSYKSEDRPRAKIIAEALEQHGYSVWWDRIIPPGKTFDQVIEEALDAAKCEIILWSRESVSSDWVKNEAREGTRRHILVPVLIDDVKIPFEFRHIQAAQLTDWQGALPNPEFELLLKSIGEILGKPPIAKMDDKKPSINELNLSAQQLYEEGKYSEAIDKWEQVVNLDSKNKTAIEGINYVRMLREKELGKRKRRTKELAETGEREKQKAKQEEEHLKKPRKRQENIAKEKEELKARTEKGPPFYKKSLIVVGVLGMLLLGAWIIVPTKTQTPLSEEFVLIPAGEFYMGSPSNEVGRNDVEGPAHYVKIAKAFYMGRYEVTQKQWQEVMGNNPSYFKGYFKSDDLPVEQVSWYDVQQFIKKFNEKEGTNKYRLPSEAEWEYAARAGAISRYSFGDDESKLGDYAWYDPNSNGETHPVGQKKPNSWGLYDMYGNVKEWVQDNWHDSYDHAPTDSSAWESDYELGGDRRVNRGGSWYEGAGGCRSAQRYPNNPDVRGRDIGFRLVRDL